MDQKTLNLALKEASRKVRLSSVKERNEALSYAAGDMAEAYEIGVEDCQFEIIHRIKALILKAPFPPSLKDTVAEETL